MKKWYQFYAENASISLSKKLQQLVGEIDETKLDQIATMPTEEKVQHAVGELAFPSAFSYVPWSHHILIITKCRSIEEALFYIRMTIEKCWSRSALDDNIKVGLYRISGKALTNFDEKLPLPQGKLAQEIF